MAGMIEVLLTAGSTLLAQRITDVQDSRCQTLPSTISMGRGVRQYWKELKSLDGRLCSASVSGGARPVAATFRSESIHVQAHVTSDIEVEFQ